jgi:L-fuconolactonase
MIDSHQHFWRYNADEFGWVTDDMAILRNDFLPASLQQAIAGTGVDGVVTVQARRSMTETEWLLDLARQHPLIKGVVGWVPLKDPAVGEILDRLAENPLFRGVREVIQGEPDTEFLDCPAFHRGVRELTSRGIPYDLLIFHYQLSGAIKFVDAHPNQRFVVDHIAKPEIRNASNHAWAYNLKELAKRPNVFCKFSGVTTEVRELSWDISLIRPCFETAIEAFGVTRLMFGSDWPVCLLRTTYTRWMVALKELAANLSDHERMAFFSRTVRNAYNLKF